MLDKDQFFEKYKVKKAFEQSDLSWDTLEEIYDDYCSRKMEIVQCTKDLEQYIRDHLKAQIHSIRLPGERSGSSDRKDYSKKRY